MIMTQEWFTVGEAAEYLRVSKRTIYKFTKDGKLPAFRISKERHRRFRKEDLDKIPQLGGNESLQALTSKNDPVLGELWNNDKDADYDRL